MTTHRAALLAVVFASAALAAAPLVAAVAVVTPPPPSRRPGRAVTRSEQSAGSLNVDSEEEFEEVAGGKAIPSPAFLDVDDAEELAEVADGHAAPSVGVVNVTSVEQMAEVAEGHAAPGRTPHPMWKPEWERALRVEVILCFFALLFVGVFTAAAGVGGGGVYVAVLMVAGKLSPYDAVPLSKAIVFFGAIASLAVNVYKRFAQGVDSTIDVDVCKLVVPAALLGTFIGVLLNWNIPDMYIAVVLEIVLALMTGMVTQMAVHQYRLECSGAAAEPTGAPSSNPQDGAGAGSDMDPTPTPVAVDQPGESAGGPAATGALAAESLVAGPAASSAQPPEPASCGRGTVSWIDCVLAFSLLVVIILAGALRYHVRRCSGDLHSGIVGSEACTHPVLQLIFGGQLERRLKGENDEASIHATLSVLPIASCLAANAYYAHSAVAASTHQQSAMKNVALLQIMSLFTGILAGLVGIGGGLIFSPFFLLIGVDPAVAVGTSSTCVLFTSSSTTMQYALTDRIIPSLSLVYGLAVLVASMGGTTLVHILRDKFPMRKSLIMFIVTGSVAASAALVCVKLLGIAGDVVHDRAHALLQATTSLLNLQAATHAVMMRRDALR